MDAVIISQAQIWTVRLRGTLRKFLAIDLFEEQTELKKEKKEQKKRKKKKKMSIIMPFASTAMKFLGKYNVMLLPRVRRNIKIDIFLLLKKKKNLN